MIDEPEIVKEMRQAEKHGILQKKLQSSYKELYLTENENKDSKNKYKLLVEQSLQGIVIVQDFRIVFANNAFVEFSGYNIEELYSLSPEQVMGMIHPDDQKLVWTRFQDRLAGKPTPSRYEYRGIRKDGPVRWFEMSASRIMFNGAPAIQGVIIDITEQKEFMDALKESEEQLRLTFENAIDAIFWADPETGMIIKCNRAAELLLEKKREEIVGQHQTMIHPPEKAEYYANKFKRHIDQNGAFEDEAEIFTKSKKIVPVGITASVTKIGGKPLIQGIFRDITKQKLTEEKLRRSTFHFKQLFNVMADPVIIVNSKGNFLAVSDKVENITGYKRNELIGKNFIKTNIVTIKSKVILLKNLFKRMSGVKIKPYEIEVVTKDGEIIPFEINATKIDYMGKPADMVIFRDIRARKQSEKSLRESEEKFRNLAEESPNMIFIVKNGKIVYINNRCKEIIGYKKDELYKSDFDFLKIIFSDNQTPLKNNHKWHKTSEEISPYEYTFISNEGKSIETIITTKSISYEGEKAILGIVTDITELKKAERDLKKAHEKLKSMNIELEKKVKERTSEINKILKQKDEFISQLGHDLKNPLNPIANLLPIVLKREQDEKSKELLQAVIRNVDFMKNLVIKTIQLARLNVPDVKFSMEKINLYNEINNVLENNKSILEEARIIVENKINRNIIVKTDKLRFEELFDNLINNAIKYSPDGGKITIDGKEDEELITISIKDSGIGMTTDQIDYIFDEFYKADKSRHDFDSSGLGLPICKRIVEKQGGKIWAESKGIGKGCNFYFTVLKDFEKISKNIPKQKNKESNHNETN